jgi:hypothetical protein
MNISNSVHDQVFCITVLVFIGIQNDYEANILSCTLHICVGIIEDAVSRERNVGKTAKATHSTLKLVPTLPR